MTISCGGGGIPVVGTELKGVEAVIDKDFASEKLADLVAADLFVILNGCGQRYINYGKENQQKLTQVSIADWNPINRQAFCTRQYVAKNRGSHSFVQNNPDKQAVITSLENLGRMSGAEMVGLW